MFVKILLRKIFRKYKIVETSRKRTTGIITVTNKASGRKIGEALCEIEKSERENYFNIVEVIESSADLSTIDSYSFIPKSWFIEIQEDLVVDKVKKYDY